MKNKLSFILVICCCVSLLCGCGKEITEGEVFAKEYKEARTEVRLMPLVRTNGKTTYTTVIPYTVRYPDRYIIKIKAYQNNEWVTEDFYVSAEVYESINIGDMFEYYKERGDLRDEPYTKERRGLSES